MAFSAQGGVNMKKNMKELWRAHKMLMLLGSAIILLQTVVGVLLWDRLPDPIATHFDFHNQPNGWSSRTFTVFGMPLVLLALHWICLLAECAPSRASNYSAKIKYLLMFIVPASSLLTMVVSYGYALDAGFNVGRIALVFVGVIFAVTGNYLPKIRRNYTTGIKLPWTMASEENWNRTHRMAAPVWVLCGLALIVLGLIGYTGWPMFIVIAAAVLIPTIYSFALHVRMK